MASQTCYLLFRRLVSSGYSDHPRWWLRCLARTRARIIGPNVPKSRCWTWLIIFVNRKLAVEVDPLVCGGGVVRRQVEVVVDTVSSVRGKTWNSCVVVSLRVGPARRLLDAARHIVVVHHDSRGRIVDDHIRVYNDIVLELNIRKRALTMIYEMQPDVIRKIDDSVVQYVDVIIRTTAFVLQLDSALISV